MTRRCLPLVVFMLTIFCLAASAVAAPDTATLWQQFKERFISGDGRVIDWQNNHMSHSEGQGYTLLLAVELNDPETFAKLLQWSDNNLGRGLRAWSWGRANDGWRVLDPNNATDGDIFHAWALLRAGKKWNNPDYTRTGMAILESIHRELITPDNLLLPARWGFRTCTETRLNLSYYVFPAFREFAAADPAHKAVWDRVYDSGLALYRASLNNPAKLPPDWISLNTQAQLLPLTGSDATYGFEAICIPVFLSWAKEQGALEPLRPFLTRIARQGWMPQSVNLLNPQFSAAPDNLEGGIGHYATAARAAQELGMKEQAAQLWRLADRSREKHPRNYYGEVLYLLARIL